MTLPCRTPPLKRMCIGAFGIFPVEATSWVEFQRLYTSRPRVSKENFHMEPLEPTLGSSALDRRKCMSAIKSASAGVHHLPC